MRSRTVPPRWRANASGAIRAKTIRSQSMSSKVSLSHKETNARAGAKHGGSPRLEPRPQPGPLLLYHGTTCESVLAVHVASFPAAEADAAVAAGSRRLVRP